MKRGLVLIFAVMACAMAGASPAWAEGDAERGQSMAALCSACHGPDGVSVNPLWPSLAGQQELYLVNSIKAYRDGVREDVSMQPFVATLSDQDVEDLAAYYASLTPCP